MPQRRVLSAIHDLIQASASVITFNWLEHNTMVETMEELVWQGEFSDECAALFAQNASTFEVYISEVEQGNDLYFFFLSVGSRNFTNIIRTLSEHFYRASKLPGELLKLGQKF